MENRPGTGRWSFAVFAHSALVPAIRGRDPSLVSLSTCCAVFDSSDDDCNWSADTTHVSAKDIDSLFARAGMSGVKRREIHRRGKASTRQREAGRKWGAAPQLACEFLLNPSLRILRESTIHLLGIQRVLTHCADRSVNFCLGQHHAIGTTGATRNR